MTFKELLRNFLDSQDRISEKSRLLQFYNLNSTIKIENATLTRISKLLNSDFIFAEKYKILSLGIYLLNL